MKHYVRFLSVFLSVTMIFGLLPGFVSALSISDSGFTKIGSIPNDYVATQGMCTDGKYIYTFKMISGNNNQARFYRTNISTGATNHMLYSENTELINFAACGHGNDMCAVVVNGTTYLYLATMYHKSHSEFATHSIWKFQVVGANLKKVASYDVMAGTKDINFTGLTLYKQTDTGVTLLGACGASVYSMDIKHNQASGTVSCKWVYKLNYANAPTPTGAPTYRFKDSNGNSYYGVQGMTYDNGKLYYVLTGSQTTATAKDNYIFCFDVENIPNTSSVEAIASESIYVTSSTYKFFLEFESIDIYNGTMYFSANAGKNGYYEDYDFCGKLKKTFATTPEYTVTFCDESGATLQSIKVKQGATAKFTGTTPTKAYDDTNHYTFREWLTSVGGSAATLTNIQKDMKVYAGFAATAHTYTEEFTTPATCTTEGLKTLTCTCGRTYAEVTPMADHTSIVINEKEATCTQTGYTGDTVCSLCSASLAAGTVVEKLGHTPVTDEGYAPNCTSWGLTDGSHCSSCGEVLAPQVIIPETEHDTEVIPGKAPTCLSSGISDGLACKDCGEVVKAQENLPRLGHSYTYVDMVDNHIGTCIRCSKTTTAAHSYENGTCICGATLAPEVPVDENITINHTLNLASDISINYAVKTSLLADYDSYYLECEIPVYENNAQTGIRTVEIQPVLKGSYYYFTLEGLNALSMNHMITATLHMEKAGKSYASNPDRYSIATYAYSQMNKEGAEESLKTLCANLLRYGALSQQYKNYCTHSLPDGDLTEEQKGYLTELNTVTFDSVNCILEDVSDPMVTWVGKSLILDSKVTLKFIFDASAYEGDPAALSLRVTYKNTGGEVVSVTLKEAEVYQEELNRYAFDFDGLLAAELRSIVSVAIWNGETQISPTLEYSASTYGNNKTGSLLTLCRALMAYSDKAKTYFSS